MSKKINLPAPTRAAVRGLRAILSYQAAHVKDLEEKNRQLKEHLENQDGDPKSDSDSITSQIEVRDEALEHLITGAVLRALELSGFRGQQEL
ncbi:MAG: hypothetical protein ACE5I2_02400 [Anaerolineae bacterium]